MASTIRGTWQGRAGSPFTPEKQELVASRGIVTTNHPLASAAGAEMLAAGGTAVDAAIAAAFAIAVVEPMSVGIFGAGFVLMRDARTGAIAAIDNYAVAPAAARPDMFQPLDTVEPGADPLETVGRQNSLGYLAVGVPGAVQSWCHVLQTAGTVSLEEALRPAIRYAEHGFRASPHLVEMIANHRDDLARFPATAAIFLRDGQPPSPGHLIRNPDLAETLRTIARDGPDALYHGPLGAAVADDMARNGGLLTRADFASYRIRERTPVRGTYRGYEVVSMAPTSSGGTHIVQALNLLEEFDVAGAGFGTARGIHLLAECLKIAFADRDAYMGDPDRVDVPVAGLTSKAYARQRRAEISLAQAGRYDRGRPQLATGESQSTTHLTVMDREGNTVAMTQTIHSAFGSKVVAPGTGMVLNNTMYLFDPHPGQPNSIAPGKRMLSSMSPTIVLKDGRPLMALGTPGGTRIFAAVLQAIVNVIDHGMTLQEAVEAPRVWNDTRSALLVEPGIAPGVRAELEGMGHRVEVVPKVAGGMNGICMDEAGLLHGAACWRADGAPVGLSGGDARANAAANAFG
ncbi:MAG: gamma-glutamyltransferase [Chloroflexi bacterium]|nr:gamma-glutamyltransferase [Chloroflexota bacterium]